jgi:hypothetical protein
VVVWGCVVVCGGGGPIAFEHSKVCTLCDFGHLQFLLMIYLFFKLNKYEI